MRHLILLVVAIAACSPYDPTLSQEPFTCGTTDPKCPEGYGCVADAMGKNICVSSDNQGTNPDGGSFLCADDHMLEPNDDITTAFQTPVASSRPNIVLAGLAICPAGDKDTYHIDVTVEGQNLQVDVTYDPGVPLALAILNSSGTSIVAATAVGMTTTAKVANLPMANSPYYAQVTGPAGGENNYKLSIAITGP